MATRSGGHWSGPIFKAIEAKEFESIASLCEKVESEVGGAALVSDWPYALHMFGYLINKDLESARFLWKRTPKSAIESNPEIKMVWRITQCLFLQDYQLLYEALRLHPWSKLCATTAAFFLAKFESDTVTLLTSVYTTVSLADAAKFIGRPAGDAAEFFKNLGWQLDATSMMLTVQKPVVQNDYCSNPIQLQELTQYVVHLEG
mmetsp:Transcript_15113/g.20857  ORF Transcript_15113/g.20857 Transcript_15113/m.20857 type:complete len:203 (+) Transcript_15113:236-844(+)|eukprot:CAMPEP_0196581408 /NCGR_PEP_ID=MMETSP1081-20130531/33938_1 /TAXON_ID=36882 /ORGANISM="Pyramimonas amylifera, Strain CCMP720" /LENGTH=202 /DNA_ID=CAMNT_0041901625 /DNA_START=236 /DNA_END=844 /DNA_ORIENTATION=+